jgi:hypothetical protein
MPGAYRTSDKKCKLWPMTDDAGFPAASITAVAPSRQRRLQLLSPNCVCSASGTTALLGEYRVNYHGGKPETADLTVGLASGRAPGVTRGCSEGRPAAPIQINTAYKLPVKSRVRP